MRCANQPCEKDGTYQRERELYCEEHYLRPGEWEQMSADYRFTHPAPTSGNQKVPRYLAGAVIGENHWELWELDDLTGPKHIAQSSISLPGGGLFSADKWPEIADEARTILKNASLIDKTEPIYIGIFQPHPTA